MMSAQEAAQKWAENAGRAGAAYAAGIQRTTVNPMEEAAKNVEGYLNGVQEAVSTGKWQRGLRRISKEEWQDRASKLGAARLQAGVQANKQKMASFMESFFPYLQSGLARIRAMPKATLQDRIARSVAMQEYLAQYRRQ